MKESIKSQKVICKKYNSNFNPLNAQLMIGLGTNLEFEPINGFRHPAHRTMNGWYIWSGDWSDSGDFFTPICIENLINLKPEISKYLSLDIGYRFQIDSNGYEDVWFDKKITTLE